MNVTAEMPSLMSLFRDWYGDEIVRALLDTLVAYGSKVGKGEAFNGTDGENVYFIVALVRAIFQDSHGMAL